MVTSYDHISLYLLVGQPISVASMVMLLFEGIYVGGVTVGTRRCIQRNLSATVTMRAVGPAADVIKNKNVSDQCHRIQGLLPNITQVSLSVITALDSLKFVNSCS